MADQPTDTRRAGHSKLVGRPLDDNGKIEIHVQHPPTDAVTEERRRQFEEWARNSPAVTADCDMPFDFSRDANGKYFARDTNDCWQAWQAALAQREQEIEELQRKFSARAILHRLDVQALGRSQSAIVTAERTIRELREALAEAIEVAGWGASSHPAIQRGKRLLSDSAAQPSAPAAQPVPTFARIVSHVRARDAAQRLVNSHFHNGDEARVRIPANEDDDDVVICDYIRQQAAKEPPSDPQIREIAARIRAKFHDILCRIEEMNSADRTTTLEWFDQACEQAIREALKLAGKAVMPK